MKDPKNRSASGNARFFGLTEEGLKYDWKLLVQSENLDLSLLNKSSADLILENYRKTALSLETVFKDIGIPALSLPSESPYAHYLRYIIDPFAAVDPNLPFAAPTGGIHPHLLSLMKTSFNPKHDATSLEQFKTGRGRMRSPFSHERFHERTKKLFPEGLPTSYEDSIAKNAEGRVLKPMNHLAFDKGKTYTVLTWDTETTGLTPEAQIREIALVKRTVTYNADGTMTSSAPEILTSKSFSSDLMDIAGYVDNPKTGHTVPLSEAAFISERGGDINKISKSDLANFRNAYKGEGEEALKSFKEVLRFFTNEGDILNTGLGTENLRVEGHNAESFDLDKLIGTIRRLPAFEKDKEAKRLLDKFLALRSSKSDYMLDTLDSAKVLMLHQQVELRKIMQESGLNISEDLQHGLVGSFSISPEMFGGAKGAESLENLFLNTNFFELLEGRVGVVGIDTLTGLMETRGTHTAVVDTMLNSYISDFINNNELRIRRLPTGKMAPSGLSDAAAAEYTDKAGKLQDLFKAHGFMKEDRSITAFEEFMRARIRKSSAVTPITNISDMSRISDDVFKFLNTESGMQKISMSVTPDYLARLQDNKISLGITAENLQDEASAGKIYYDQKRSKYMFSNFESRGVKDAPGFQELDNRQVAEAFKFALNESRNGKKLPVSIGGSRSIPVNASTEALSNIGITEIEATELDQMMRARRGLPSLGAPRSLSTNVIGLSKALGTTSEFYGLKGGIGFAPAVVGTTKMAEYSQALIDRGLPYATYDVRSRIMAVGEAAATSNIGKTLINTVLKSGDTTYESLKNKDLSKLSDIGIQYTIGQGKEDIFGIKHITKNGRENPTIKNSYFRTPVIGTKKSDRVIVTADDLSKLMIREFDEETGNLTGEIKFGSQEFIENANLNRFTDSKVQALSSTLQDTINRSFVPKNLSEKSTADLAEQVLFGNIKSYDTLVKNKSYITTAVQSEAETLARNIFGDQNLNGDDLITRLKQLSDMASLTTREARVAKLRELAGKADPSVVIDNYESTVKTIGESISEFGIIGMKITGKHGDKAVETINEGRLAQGISGVRDTDIALKGRIHTMIRTFSTDNDGVIGYMFSGSVTDDMDLAARNLSGEVIDAGLARAAQNEAAHTALINSGSFVDDINIAPSGLNAGEKFADDAINLGKRLYQTNKGKFAIGALALAGAVTGYKIAKRGNENDTYNATMDLAPVEQGQRPYGIQEALMGNGQTSRRKDPLFTAGIVGNLDRQKIGHTSMGPSKNSHLFGDS